MQECREHSIQETQMKADAMYGAGEWEVLISKGYHDKIMLRHKCGYIRTLSRASTFFRGSTRCACQYPEGSKTKDKLLKVYTENRLDKFYDIKKEIEGKTDGKYTITSITPDSVNIVHTVCGHSIGTMSESLFLKNENIKCSYKECQESRNKKLEEKYGIYRDNIQAEIKKEIDKEKKKLKRKYYHRKSNVASKAKELFKEINGKVYCEICTFNFEEFYGEMGKDYIVAHHIIPLKEGGRDTIENVILLCANCHAMIHNNQINKKKNRTTPDDIKKVLHENKNKM